MVPFVMSLLVIAGGFVLVYRAPRRSQRLAGALLSSMGFAATMWAHPARARLADTRALDHEMCIAAADDIERWGRSPPISSSGHVATLIQLSRPDRLVTAATAVDDDLAVKRNEGLVVSRLAGALLHACLPERCNNVRPPEELAFQSPADGIELARAARQRAADDIAAMLRSTTCPSDQARR